MLLSLTLHWRPCIPVRDLKLSVCQLLYIILFYSFHTFICYLATIILGYTLSYCNLDFCRITHITRTTTTKTLARTGQHDVLRGKNKTSWGEGKKRAALNMWRAKKWTRERHNSVNPEEVKGPSGRSVPFPPWQITQNTHNERQEYGSSSLFPSPNYQAPYWLSSGREEVILFPSPFGKLIHFTKVTW